MANEKDVAEKNLEAYNDVFADIVNGVLWGGKEVIKEDEHEAAMPRSNYESKGRTHEMERMSRSTGRIIRYGWRW